MAARKISELATLSTAAADDIIPIVDVSEAADADKNKSMRWDAFLEQLGDVKVVPASASASAETEINAAITAAASAGGGRVWLSPSTANYICSDAQAIQTKPKVILDGQGQSIEWTNAVASTTNYLIYQEPDSKVLNLDLYSSAAAQTGALVTRIGSGSAGGYRRFHDTVLENCLIRGTESAPGSNEGNAIGIYDYVDGTVAAFNQIEWVRTRGVVFSRLGFAVRQRTVNTNENFSYINGNTYADCRAELYNYGIFLQGTSVGVGAVSGNCFTNWQMQAHNGVFRNISISGNRNMFDKIFVWDFPDEATTANARVVEFVNGVGNFVEFYGLDVDPATRITGAALASNSYWNKATGQRQDYIAP